MLGMGRLQRTDGGFQAAGDFVGGHAGRKSDGRTDPHGDFAEMPEAAMFALHLPEDRKSTRLNSSHSQISYAVFCLKKKTTKTESLYASSRTCTWRCVVCR